MNIKWQQKILYGDGHIPSYDGCFAKSTYGMSFLFKMSHPGVGSQFIGQVDLSSDGKFLEFNEYKFPEWVPYYWFLFDMDGQTCACPNVPGLYVNPSKHQIVQDYSAEFAKVFEKKHKPYKYLEEGTYTFGDLIISHKGSFGYRCHSRSTGKLIWERKVKGYLYTKMLEYQGNLLFGTAEFGGKLYYVNLQTGESIFEIDTHGTRRFAIQDSYLYCYQLGKKAALLRVNLVDGSVRELPLPGKACIDCPIGIIDGTIYTMTFDRIDRSPSVPTIYAIADEDILPQNNPASE